LFLIALSASAIASPVVGNTASPWVDVASFTVQVRSGDESVELILERGENSPTDGDAELKMAYQFTALQTAKVALRLESLTPGDDVYLFRAGLDNARNRLASPPPGLSFDLLGANFHATAGTTYFVFVDVAGNHRFADNYADVQRGCDQSPFHDLMRGVWPDVNTQHVCEASPMVPKTPESIDFAPRP
jgi:hypothetical protein